MTTTPPDLSSLGVHVPRALDAVIHRLLMKDPRDRYQSADAVLADVTEIGDAMARGNPEPTLVVGLRDRRRTLTEPVFVGRRDELAELERTLDRAAHGSGGLALIEAESGGGKTRLLDELARLGAQAGFTVFRGQGIDQAAQRPFQLLSGVASDLLLAHDRDPRRVSGIKQRLSEDAGAVSVALPDLAEVLGAPDDASLGPEAYGEARAVRALGSLLDAIGTASKPALILLDDGQWSDEPTIKLLAEWADVSSADRHVVVLVAFRSEEVNERHPLRQMHTVAQSRLGPLGPDEIRALSESMAGALPAEATDLVIDLAEGSPFMASATLRGLVESGVLIPEPSGWRVESTALGEIQSSRQAATLLTRRLQLLPANALRLLTVGAVLGKEFDLQFAAELAQQPGHEAMAGFEEARRRHIVWARHDSTRCMFVHDKLREALLDLLAPQERRELHRTAAEQIERTDPSRAFELAYHFDAAGHPERGLDYALEAGSRARAQHSLEIAEQQYRIAERGVAAAGDDVRRRIAEGLGDVLMLRGQYEEASHRLRDAAGLAEDELIRATIEAKQAELAFKRGDLQDAGSSAEGALRRLGMRVPRTSAGFLLAAVWEILVQATHTLAPRLFCGRRSLEDAGPTLLAVRLYSRLAHVYWFSRGSVPTLWTHLREMNIAERYPPTLELAQAYSEHAPVMTLLPWWSRGIRYVERSLRIRTDFGDVWGQGQSLNFYGIVLYNATRYDECIERCGRAARLLQRTGDRWELNIAHLHIAFALYRKGDLEAAIDEARRVHQSGLEIGDPQASGLGVEIWSKAAHGAIPSGPVRMELERETDDVQLRAEVMQAEAVRVLAKGKPGKAAEILTDALRRVRKAGLRQEYVAPIRAWLATALREAAEAVPPWDPRERRRLLRRARRAARGALRMARFYRNNLPHALREVGRLAAIRGRRGRARRRLDRALNVAEGQGARAEYLQTLLLRGRIGATAGWAGAQSDMATAFQQIGPAPDEDELGDGSQKREAATLSLVDRFDALLDAGRRIAAALSREAIYDELRAATLRLLRGQHCIVLGVVDTDEGVDVTAVSGELDQRYSRTLALRAIDEGKPVVHGQAAEPDSGESLELASLRSALCAPILVRGRPVAAVHVSHDEVGALFGPDEEHLASFITTLAGAALENAEGFAEVQALTRTLERRVQERTTQLERSNRALDASLKRLQEAYDRERDVVRKLRELDELKSDFLSTISHELRTPLTSIEGFAQTLTGRWADLRDEIREDFMTRISTNAAELNTMIGELLDFSRLERGHLKIEPRPCRIETGLRASVEKLHSVLGQHEVSIDVEGDLVVLAEDTAFSRILENLLTNAAKFSAPGTRITVDARPMGDEVAISVTDQGIGIPPEETERVFERFYRIERGDHARTRGTGIGLAIVKEYVEAHGGRVWIESEPGYGTTFTFTLRRPPAPQISSAEPDPAERSSA